MAYIPNNGFNTAALMDWIKSNESIVDKLYNGSPTVKYLLEGKNAQVGNKPGQSAINMIEHTSNLSVAGCGRTLSGNTPLGTELITTVGLTESQLYCNKDLEGTFYNWALMQGQNPKGGYTNEFFMSLVDGKLRATHEAVEILVWLGNTANGDILNGIDVQVPNTVILSGSDVVDKIQDFWNKVPSVLRSHPETRIHIGRDVHDIYVAALANRNIYKPVEDLVAYGTTGKFEISDGINGTDKIYIINRDFTVMSTDLSSDIDTVTFDYSIEQKGYYLDIDFALGLKLVRTEYAYKASLGSGLLPTITTQPVNATEDVGDTATFVVVATNATSYQWQVNTGTGFSNISGATNASYTTPALSSGDTGRQYRVLVSNVNGNITSSVATVTVN